MSTVCASASCTGLLFEIGFFWERPIKGSSGMESDSSATPLHSILVSSNAETVQLASSEVWLRLLKWQFLLVICHRAAIRRQTGKQNASGTGKCRTQRKHRRCSYEMWFPTCDSSLEWMFVYLISLPLVLFTLTTRAHGPETPVCERVRVCARARLRVQGGKGTLWGARTSIWAKVIGLPFIFSSVLASSCSYIHTWTSYRLNNQRTAWLQSQFITRGLQRWLERKSNLLWWDAEGDESESDWICLALPTGLQSVRSERLFFK